jgi:antitoxin (DNA-binding transcriptional repressor) of toxin-antitoxin stability system
VNRATHGETIVVSENDKAVAKLRPYSVIDVGDDRLNTLIREGKVIPPDKAFVLPQVGASMRPGYSLSDVVIEERHADRLLG